ncbi:Fanconi anemia group G protein isoform X2 [Paramormyrops kingsleyae]|uniref:Fanconi anemia group G protein isoform X2 n=1 Tax=Paramormyrops kingsleyae TaxID=1676925 RepID=UPI003B97BBBC
MSPSDCLVIWTEQNNDIVKKWKCAERKHKANGQDVRCQYYNELCSLLHIIQGVGKMKEGKDSEAVQILQDASMLPSPTSLLAEIHMRTGICLARLGRPQSSLQCYRRALEMGASSRTVLYQCSLLHRQLENCPAEIEMLRLLCTAAHSPVSCDPSSTWVPLLTPDTLLGDPACDSVFAMPSLLEMQHTLAHRCLHCGRFSEAAENYLDLLATLQCDLKQLVNTDVNSRLPRVPDIYLEAAVTLLKAERYWDSIAICEEVIMKTAELIPDRLVLEMPLRDELDDGSLVPFSPEMRGLFAKSGKAEERLNYVLWAGTAFLIEGQAYGWLKESKGEITALTRSINLLVKVRLKNEEWQHRDPGDNAASKVAALRKLKALALASRGVGFMDRKQEGAALQDFQLSLQASPGTEVVELWLTRVLWNMGREEEATTFWKSTRRTSQVPELVPNCSRNAAVFLHLQSYLQEKMPADSESLKKMKLSR